MQNWFLQTLSDVFNRHEEPDAAKPDDQILIQSGEQLDRTLLKAQGEWFGAIAALEQLLLPIINAPHPNSDHDQGLLLCRPTPVLSHSALIARFQTGIFTQEAFKNLALMPFQLPPSQESSPAEVLCPIVELPLFPNDPITAEQFCLVFTPNFALVMVLGTDNNQLPAFQFSFEPEVIQQAWQILRSRLLLTNHPHRQRLEELIETFPPPHPDYRLVMQFSRQLLKHLPDFPAAEARKPRCAPTISEKSIDGLNSSFVPLFNLRAKSKLPLTDISLDRSPELELLQAFTHEIRTPLTTIRTLTRLLLKRSDLTPDVIKRLEAIDQECTEQINRMELIFRAAEIETTPIKQQQVQMIPIALERVFQESIPQWKKQAQRRNVILDVVLPKKLPTVISDPAMLERMLTGVMEKFIRSLTTGGQIRVLVSTAGNQLKLQFLSPCSDRANPLKALGQLLMFQPETGSLSLNLNVTKNLFNALGGKLIVRQRPQEGEVLTIFLPLGNLPSEVNPHPEVFVQPASR